MSDTIQLVQWALGQTCSIRPSRDDGFPETPSRVLKQVRMLQTYGRGLVRSQSGSGVHGDIFVTFTKDGSRPEEKKSGSTPKIPSGGFIISKTFAPYGGVDELKQQCSRCPANIEPPAVAQCAGYLDQRPDSSATEEQLQDIISRLGLAKEMTERFPATTPLWYGLWAVSPVPVESLPLLRLLLGEILEEDRRDAKPRSRACESQFREFQNFLSAIDVAEARKLPLHVELLPPGHADFGIYTVFPHCPFCKAGARTPRWRQHYPTELLECHVCGTRFSPAETASRRKMSWNFEGLRKELGDEAYLRFTAEFLRAGGEPPEEIPGIVAATEEQEREREAMNRKRLEEGRRQQEYIETHVFRDLPRVSSPKTAPLERDEDDEGDDEQEDDEAVETAWFAIEQVEEIIRRCESLGVAVLAMMHRSRNECFDRYRSMSEPGASAAGTLANWTAEGCNEKFWVSCRVPADLLQ